jgi:Tfp pilus assembly protein PilP
MRAHRAVLTSIGLVTVVGACSGSPPPPPPKPVAAAQPPAPTPAQTPAAQPPAQPPGTAPAPAAGGQQLTDPTVIVPPPDPAVSVPKYESKGRRDPFETLEVREGAGGLTVASTRLTGIVRSNRVALALIEAPDGIGYILKPGDTLGDGRLLEIGSDSVVFVVTAKAGAPNNRVVLRLATN